MKLANCRVGDCFFASSRAWGGGEYPLIVLDINRRGFNYECHHPNGKIYNLASRAEVRRATEAEFHKVEKEFEHAVRVREVAKTIGATVEETARAMRLLGNAFKMSALTITKEYSTAVRTMVETIRTVEKKDD